MKRGQAFPSTYLTKEDFTAPRQLQIQRVEIDTLDSDDGFCFFTPGRHIFG